MESTAGAFMLTMVHQPAREAAAVGAQRQTFLKCSTYLLPAARVAHRAGMNGNDLC